MRRVSQRRGFSLVELLAAVLILAVLAGVATPLYLSSRKSAAARSCLGQEAAIAAAESAYALRNGAYVTTVATLVGAPEGLAETPLCPLDRSSAYTLSVDASGNLTITCPNAASHASFVGTAANYSRTLQKPTAETLP